MKGYNSRFESCDWLIGSVHDYELFQPYLIKIQSHEFVIWRDKFKIHGIENVCPHAGASLAEGEVCKATTKTFIKCPYHGLLFDGNGVLSSHVNFDKVKKGIVGGQVSKPVNVFQMGDFVWINKDGVGEYIPDITETYFGTKKFCQSGFFNGVTEVSIDDFMANVIDTNHFANVHNKSFFISHGEASEITSSRVHVGFNMDLYKRKMTKKDKYNILYHLTPKLLQSNVTYFAPGVVVIQTPFDSFLSQFGYGSLKGQKIIAIVSCWPRDDDSLEYRAEFWQNFELPAPIAKILNYFMGRFQKKLFEEDFRILDNIRKPKDFQQNIFLKNEKPILLMKEILSSL